MLVALFFHYLKGKSMSLIYSSMEVKGKLASTNISALSVFENKKLAEDMIRFAKTEEHESRLTSSEVEDVIYFARNLYMEQEPEYLADFIIDFSSRPEAENIVFAFKYNRDNEHDVTYIINGNSHEYSANSDDVTEFLEPQLTILHGFKAKNPILQDLMEEYSLVFSNDTTHGNQSYSLKLESGYLKNGNFYSIRASYIPSLQLMQVKAFGFSLEPEDSEMFLKFIEWSFANGTILQEVQFN